VAHVHSCLHVHSYVLHVHASAAWDLLAAAVAAGCGFAAWEIHVQQELPVPLVVVALASVVVEIVLLVE